MLRRSLLAVLALAGALLALSACGGDDGGSGDAAADGGGDRPTLTVYSGRNEGLVGPLVQRYERERGVDLQVRYGDTAELAATILEEGENSPADVFFAQDAGALGAVQDANRLVALPQELLDRVDPEFRSDEGRWIGASGRARVIAFDERELEAAEFPESVLGLTGETWRGRIGWAPTNGSFQAFVTALRVLEGEDTARQWLEGMVANDTQVYENNIAIRDAIAAGEIDAGLINHYYVAEAEAEEGEDYPVGLYFPSGDVGSLINVAGVGVLGSSDKREAALDFARFLLSEEAQRYFASETKEYPLAAGVQPDPELVPLSEIDQPDIDLSQIDDLQGTVELLQQTGAL